VDRVESLIRQSNIKLEAARADIASGFVHANALQMEVYPPEADLQRY
jgi:hypothetical protein